MGIGASEAELTGDYELSAGHLAFDIQGKSAGAFDQLHVKGSATFAGGQSTVQLVLGRDYLSSAGGTGMQLGDTFDLVLADQSVLMLDTLSLELLVSKQDAALLEGVATTDHDENYLLVSSQGVFQLSLDDTGKILRATVVGSVVPEPGTNALMALGVLLMGLSRRLRARLQGLA